MLHRSFLPILLALSTACRGRHSDTKDASVASVVSVVSGVEGASAASAVSSVSLDSGALEAGPMVGSTYRSAVGGFQVRFPDGKTPDVETAAVFGGLSVRLFKVQYGTSGYLVAYDELSKGEVRTAQQALDAAREGILETTGGTLDSEVPISLEGHSGRDIVVSATTSGIKMRQHLRAYFVGSRLYTLLVIAPPWSTANEIESQFFDSFAWLADAGP